MIYAYPPEVHEFVKTHCREMRDAKLAEACNAAMGTEFTKEKMRAFRANHKYHNGLPKGRLVDEMYPDGMVDYIRTHSWGVSSKEMAEQVNALYGTHFTATGMKQFRQRHGIKSGVPGWYQKGHAPGNKGKKQEEYMSGEAIIKARQTQFKKGDRPKNELPVGTVVVNADGYKLLKVKMDGSQWERWVPLHRAVWEEHNGPVPEGMTVSFKDSNSLNCDINNLILISRGENAVLAKKGLRSEDPDITTAAVSMVRLQMKVNEKRRKKGGNDEGSDREGGCD